MLSGHLFGLSRSVATPVTIGRMTKGKFPNGLAEAMKRAGITVTALARAVDTSKQNVSRHMHGERRLNETHARRYAPVLHVEPQTLIFPTALPPARRHPTPRRQPIDVPLLSWVSAGRLFPQEPVSTANVRRTLLAIGLPPGDWIALEVEGDSMNLIAPAGAIIYVDRADDRMLAGRFYVFSTEAGEATFKRYRADPFRLQPYSTNPDHETYYPSSELRVIGRVRRVVNDI